MPSSTQSGLHQCHSMLAGVTVGGGSMVRSETFTVLVIVFVSLLLLLSHILLLLVWQAPLGVRSAKRRHQSPEWTIRSHSYCLIQGEIVRPQVLLDSLRPCSSRTSWWSPPVLRRGSSYDTHILAMWPNRERHYCMIFNIGICPSVCLPSVCHMSGSVSYV